MSTAPDQELWKEYTDKPWSSVCGVASIFEAHNDKCNDWQKAQIELVKNVFVEKDGARGAMVEMVNKLNAIYKKEPLFFTEF